MRIWMALFACVPLCQALAEAKDCSGPSYGDSPEQAAIFIKGAEAPPPPIIKPAGDFLGLICESKFNDPEHKDLRGLGVPEKAIDRFSVVEIAARIVIMMSRWAEQKPEEENP